MLPDEKDRLLAFFESERHWCQNAEARDTHGNPVKFHDPSATAWDITGAMCRLFGWKRACALFGQLEQHIHKRTRLPAFKRDAAVESMVMLQAYNDRPERTFDVIHSLLETMPVWNGVPSPSNAAARPTETPLQDGFPPRSITEHNDSSEEDGVRCQNQEVPAANGIASSRNASASK